MGWTSLPALQVSSAPAYLRTIESHKDIYPVYQYSVQMPDRSSKFKGYHNLNKLSLLDDLPVASLHTHTFMCLYRWHTSTAHTHTATSPHSEIMSSFISVKRRKSQSLEPRETVTDYWVVVPPSPKPGWCTWKGMWTWNVSEHRYGFWGTHSCKTCWGSWRAVVVKVEQA